MLSRVPAATSRVCRVSPHLEAGYNERSWLWHIYFFVCWEMLIVATASPCVAAGASPVLRLDSKKQLGERRRKTVERQKEENTLRKNWHGTSTRLPLKPAGNPADWYGHIRDGTKPPSGRASMQVRDKTQRLMAIPASSETLPGGDGKWANNGRLLSLLANCLNIIFTVKCLQKASRPFLDDAAKNTKLTSIASVCRQGSMVKDRCCENIPCSAKKSDFVFLCLWWTPAFMWGLTRRSYEPEVAGNCWRCSDQVRSCHLLFHCLPLVYVIALDTVY